MTNVLVTGASRGIGRAIAGVLAHRGATVALHGSNRVGLEETLRSLPGRGHTIVCADLADFASLERLWEDANRALGRIECLVNNAGIYPSHPPLTTDYAGWAAAWRRTLDVNLLAPAHLSFFAAHALEGRGGRIVNISSRGAFRGEPEAPAYAASKAGLNALGQSLAKALASKGVYIFTIAPGWVDTERTAAKVHSEAVLAEQPLGRVATAQEVAQVTAYCVFDAPPSLTGAILDVNGASYLRN